MRGYRSTLLAVCCLAVVASSLSAADPKPAEGTLTVDDHVYKLVQAVAFEVPGSGEPLVAVLVSDRSISADKIKKALAEGKDAAGRILSQPHVVLLFNKAGELDRCVGRADNANFQDGPSNVAAECKLSDGRARGTAKMVPKEGAPFKLGFDLKFDVALGIDAASKPTAPGAPVKPTVSGTFKGNGKAAKLAYVTVKRTESFGDEPALSLVFTEKDHTRDPKPDFKASFGDYGSALILSVHDDGQVFGCQVAHSAHQKGAFSSIGSIKTDAFEAGGGKVSGRITTDGEQETFGQTWEVNIEFAAPFAEAATPPKSPAAPPKKAVAKPDRGDRPAKPARPEKPAKPKAAKPKSDKPVAAMSALDIPLPKGATDVERDAFVKHITFKSTATIDDVAAELITGLAAQGWTKDGFDLVGEQAAILMRVRGDAKLTIVINPAGKGCEARIVTEGLDWEQQAEKP